MRYNGDDELTQDAGSTYTYDAEGNLLTQTARSGGATTTYQWDGEHRLTSATLPASSTTTYRYDPFGSLVETDRGSGVTRYAYDGPDVGAEFDGGNALTASYVQGDVPFTQLEMTRGGQRYFNLVDGLGSTTALTDASGNVVQRYAYDSYGNVTGGGAVFDPFQFTGQLLDQSTGLYSTPLREYSPTLGRWLSQDPLPSADRYPYASNDPVNLTDPSGAQDTEEEATLDAQTASLARTGSGKIEVYYARTASNKCYFGITGRGLGTRLAEHNANGKNFVDIVKITETFTRGEARVVEQFLIDNGGGLARNGGKLLNIINSVADGSPLFNLAVGLSSQLLAASAVLTSLASICV
jgi:RHS repeat-associated protein